jgi:RNA-directed DNA polymerase
MRAAMRDWKLPLRSDQSSEALSRMFNPKIRGWLPYEGRYDRSARYPILRPLDRSLARWADRKSQQRRGH